VRDTGEAMKKKDKAMAALLDLLKKRPELVHALVFDHAKVRKLLKTKAAKGLAHGADATKALHKRVAKAKKGAKLAIFGGSCPRGTYL
jgi:hypothetical protein